MRFVMSLSILASLLLLSVVVQASTLPTLSWTQRSDWINVKTDPRLATKAYGDGTHDDTGAIQAALNLITPGNGVYTGPRTLYFPSGNYRITSTLTLSDVRGGNLIGCGNGTRLFWAGASSGSIFRSNGNSRMCYIGIVWDGMDIAGTGIEHNSTSSFETVILNKHCQFKNFTIAGLRTPGSAQATAEMFSQNCLFNNNTAGAEFHNQNDLGIVFEGCEFSYNGIGINVVQGSVRIRNTHFDHSSTVDISLYPHSNGIHRCTSVGSRMFLTMPNTSTPCNTLIEDCRIDGWTNATGGAISFGSGGPLALADVTFTNPPSTTPPVKLTNWSTVPLPVLYTNVVSSGTSALFTPGANSTITQVPNGSRTGNVTSASQTWFSSTASTPGAVYDATAAPYNATPNGGSDDTTAIQNCINDARTAGNGAIAYIPPGVYSISSTLNVTGGNYYVGGSGWTTRLDWTGGAGPMFSVVDPQTINMEFMQLNTPSTVAGIIQTSQSGGSSWVKYNYVFCKGGAAWTTYRGMEFESLPTGAVVLADWTQGSMNFNNCSRATIVIGAHHTGNVIVRGATYGKTGFLGFAHNEVIGEGWAGEIHDNQDLIVGDWYTEQNCNYLYITGDSCTTPGRVTIFGDKDGFGDAAHPMGDSNRLVDINNYTGRILISNGHRAETYGINYSFYHTGTRACDLMYVNGNYTEGVVSFTTGSGAKLIKVANLLDDSHATPHNTVMPDVKPTGWDTSIAAAFDDLSELGAKDLMYYHGSGGTQGPYGGTARAIPGTIEAEDYDTGGEGLAYHDTSTGNNGGVYRSDDVDVQTCSDTGAGYNVAWISNGEWAEYTVNVTAGTYNLDFRVGSTDASGQIVAKLDGVTLGTVSIPYTGGWQVWQTVSLPNIVLSGGNDKILRLEFVNTNFNLNKVTFTTVTPSAPTFVAAGAVTSGDANITPAMPTGLQTNDILLMFVETDAAIITFAGQGGGTWTAVTGSPQNTTGTRLTAYWSRYNGSQVAPTMNDSGDHQLARIIAIRGATTSGNPWDVTAGGVESTADTSGSIPGPTTTVANTLVVTAIASSLPDAVGSAQFSAWTNANLTSVTERTDDTCAQGTGGGLGIATGVKATAGACGNTAVTLATAGAKGMLSIAIKP